MVQRSSTYVTTSKSCMDVTFGGLYGENRPPTEDADLLFMSFPNPVIKRLHQDAAQKSPGETMTSSRLSKKQALS